MNTDEKNRDVCVLKMAKSHFKFHTEGILFLFQVPLFPRQRSVGTQTCITSYVLLNLTSVSEVVFNYSMRRTTLWCLMQVLKSARSRFEPNLSLT